MNVQKLDTKQYLFPLRDADKLPIGFIPSYSKHVKDIITIQERLHHQDMRGVLNFFEQNYQAQRGQLMDMIQKNILEDENLGGSNQKHIEAIQFEGEDGIHHLTIADIKHTLQAIPSELWKLSCLETIDLTGGNQVYKYKFHTDGTIDWSKKVKLIPVNEIESQNPFFLIGRSDGKTIYNTAIAPDMTINKKPEAVSVYQQYVFLHEFFHTIESMRRTPEQRRDIVLEYNGTSYTFQDWWEEFEDIMLSGQEPEYISQYAKTYTWSINQETKKENYRLFSHCIAESVADSFAAYFVKTIGGETGYKNFRTHSFGNHEFQRRFENGEIPYANKKYELIERLCHSKVIKDDFDEDSMPDRLKKALF